MNLNTLGIGQCIAQFEQRDVGILLDQFHKECLVRIQFTPACGPAAFGRNGGFRRVGP
ncbi:MAG: hypothetical protein ACOYJQ_12545 [Pseudochelatococcus sp.]|jgi:hypothetical protein